MDEQQHESSTVIDTEFDVVDELRRAVEDIEKTRSDDKNFLEKTGYLKFLVNELDDSLSGEYEALRRRRFITKKSS